MTLLRKSDIGYPLSNIKLIEKERGWMNIAKLFNEVNYYLISLHKCLAANKIPLIVGKNEFICLGEDKVTPHRLNCKGISNCHVRSH